MVVKSAKEGLGVFIMNSITCTLNVINDLSSYIYIYIGRISVPRRRCTFNYNFYHLI